MRAPHRIDEFVFDVQLAGSAMPLAQADDLRALVVEQVLPMIDTLFDQLGGDEVLWRIDRLDLDVGDVTAAQLPDRLVSRLREALLAAMQQHDGTALEDGPSISPGGAARMAQRSVVRARRIDGPSADRLALLDFLAHGALPPDLPGRHPGAGDSEVLDQLLERVLARDPGAFLRAVAASPRREAMLTRLAHQFASTRQQALLAALPPSGMGAWMNGMNRLEAGLKRAGLSSTEADGARRAAWRLVFSRGLAPQSMSAVDEHDQGAVLQALLVAAIEWLAQQQRRTVPTVARSLLSELQGPPQAGPVAKTQAEEGSDSTASTSAVMAALAEVLGGVSPAAQPGKSTSAPTSTAVPAEHIISHAIAEASASAPAEAGAASPEAPYSGVQARIRAALMQDAAADAYAHWPQWRAQHPEILRSALLHYGAYPAVADRLAATYPLSLLLEVLDLIHPLTARLTEAAWDDAVLAALVAPEHGHRAWRRQWWRSALARSLAQASSSDQPASASQAVASAEGQRAFMQAHWLEIASDLQWPESVLRYLRQAGWTSRPALESDHERGPSLPDSRATTTAAATESLLPPAPALTAQTHAPAHPQSDRQAPPLAQVLADIRAGRGLVQRAGVPLAWLLSWVTQAVPDATFREAITRHAQQLTPGPDLQRYYARVLEALARQQPVDLEQCAAPADDGIGQAITQQQLAHEVRPARTADAALADYATDLQPAHHAQTARSVEQTDQAGPIDSPRHDDAHHLQRWAGQLSAAFMRADPSRLYADWDELVRTQAELIVSALRHYGRHDTLLGELSSTFPESMLRDMAGLLTPTLAAQWNWLLEGEGGAGALSGSMPASAEIASPHPAALAQWRRRLWRAILQYGLSLSSGQDRLEEDAPAITAARAAWSEFMARLQGQADMVSQPWQRQRLAQWASHVEQAAAVVETPVAVTPQMHAPASSVQPVKALQLTALALAVEVERVLASAASDPLAMPPTLSSVSSQGVTTPVSPALRAGWRARLSLLSADTRWLHGPWNAAALQALVLAHLHAGQSHDDQGEGADAAPSPSLADLQRRMDFFATLLRQEPGALAPPMASDTHTTSADMQARQAASEAAAPGSTPAGQTPPASASLRPDHASGLPRQRYWRQILQALLADQPLDLEEIVTSSHAAEPGLAEHADTVVLSEPVTSYPDTSSLSTEAAMSDTDTVADHLAYLQRADFSPASKPPAHWLSWLQRAIAAPVPAVAAELAKALSRLSRHGPAVQALLEWLPSGLWRALTALSPRPAAQVRHGLAVANDVADVYAQAAGVGETAMRASVRRFLLPWLFQAERGFALTDFCGALVAALGQELGGTPAGLAERLQRQMGVSLATAGTGQDGAKAAETFAEAAPVDFPVDGMSVSNAGMVLLWPFIGRAWEHLELTSEGRFHDDQAAQRAVWLLQYAVFGHMDFPEYHLPLNKLLSGMPPGATLATTIEVSPAEHELVAQLLSVVISHWNALGSTSVAGLRETFLQRDARLSRKEDGWHLHIRARTFDMLLDRLPWSIGTIRFPWMQEALWVHWR